MSLTTRRHHSHEIGIFLPRILKNMGKESKDGRGVVGLNGSTNNKISLLAF